MPEAIAPPADPAAPSPNAVPARPAAPAPSKPPAPAKPAAPAKPLPSKPASAAPAKVISPFDQANLDMDRFADPEPDEPGAAKTPPKPSKPDESATEDDTKPGEEDKPDDKGGPEGKPGEPAAEKPVKTSPWKLVESYKGRAIKAELRVAELEAAQKPGELPKEHQEKFSTIEARNKELEDEIRHVNYSKSKEFTETYQKPYEEAWTNAIADLKELVITNDDGSSRTATAQDLIALSNMPLGQARATAKAWFGDSADDVMSHRRTIRDLSDKQTKALEDSKKNGGERDQQRTAEMQAKHKARAEETAKVWSQVNAEALEKYDFLRPVDGETERNEKLEKATAFVDKTLKMNLSQAKTVEERDAIIRSHSALRNRAIGYSVFKHENVGLKAKVAELEKAIAEFQASEPTNGGPKSQQNGEHGGGDEMGAAMGRMSNYVT